MQMYGRVEDAMRYLRRYSFVAHVEGEGPLPICSIHRQVQLYTQNRMDAPAFQQCLEIAVDLLRHQFPHRSPFAEPFNPFSHKWHPAESWISHLVSVKKAVGNFKGQVELPRVYISLLLDGSVYLWERGFLEQGSELISAAQDLCEGEQNPRLMADIQCFYACILSDFGQIDKAHDLFEKQVGFWRGKLVALGKTGNKASMNDELLLANAYNNLAGIQCSQQLYHEAEVHNTLSLELKKRWINDMDMDLLLSLSYSNLGNLYGRQRRWEESALNFETALRLGYSSDTTLRQALTTHNYGCMRLAEGHVDKAQDLLTTALQMRSSSLGDHYQTASTLHMLAKCYCALADFENARYVHLELWSAFF